jgi:hypothetical protein
MTVETLGAVLIVVAILLALVLGLPLLIGVIRLDGSRKRLLGCAAQLRSRRSRSTAGGWPQTVRPAGATGGQPGTHIVPRRATLVLWGSTSPLTGGSASASRRLTGPSLKS